MPRSCYCTLGWGQSKTQSQRKKKKGIGSHNYGNKKSHDLSSVSEETGNIVL